jgi:small subunit ribosomal protein S16
MALAMRLSRGGRKSRPFYRIVVADKRMPRDGRYIERLGTYNPMLANDDEKRVMFNEERVKYWLSQGAEPSTRVQTFLGKAGLMDMPEIRETPKKSAQSEKTKMKLADKEEKLKAKADADAAEKAEAEAAPAEEASAEEVPAETPAEVPAEQPAEQAEEAPAEVPAEKPAEEAKEAPTEVPAETPAEAPAEEKKDA